MADAAAALTDEEAKAQLMATEHRTGGKWKQASAGLLCFFLFVFFGSALAWVARPIYINEVLCPGWRPPVNDSDHVAGCTNGAYIYGFTQAIDALGAVVMGKAWGALADVHGRKVFMAMCPLSFALWGLALFLSSVCKGAEVGLILLSAVFSGLFCPGTFIFATFIIDTVPVEQLGLCLGLLSGTAALAFGVGLPVGSYVWQQLGPSTFLVCTGGSLLTCLLTCALPESLASPKRGGVDWSLANPIGTLRAFIFQKRLRALVITLTCNAYAAASFLSQLVNYAIWRWNFDSSTAGFTFGGLGVSMIISIPLTYRLCSGSDSRVYAVSTAMQVVGFVAAAFASYEERSSLYPLIGLALVGWSVAQAASPALQSIFSQLSSAEDQADMQANLSIWGNALAGLGSLASTELLVLGEKRTIWPGGVQLIAAGVSLAGLVNFLLAGSPELEKCNATAATPPDTAATPPMTFVPTDGSPGYQKLDD